MTELPSKKGKSLFIVDTKYRIILFFILPIVLGSLFPILEQIIKAGDQLKVRKVKSAILKYKKECLRYPESLELLTATSVGCKDSKDNPYLNEIPKDRNGRKLFYEQNIINFVIKVNDGKPSGLGVMYDSVDTN